MAVYNSVSARTVIRRVYDHFNVVGSDWEIRSIEWIGEALRQLNIYNSLEQCHTDLTLVNHKAKLPCDLFSLRAVEANGNIMDLTHNGAINKFDSVVLSEISNLEKTYELTHTGYIMVNNVDTANDDKIRIHYLKVPDVFDDELAMRIPLVPDNEKVLEALSWYVFYRLLGRGYKSPVYSLRDPIEHLNPYRMWLKHKPKAKNIRMDLNKDEREMHKRIWNNMIPNLNRAIQKDIINR